MTITLLCPTALQGQVALQKDTKLVESQKVLTSTPTNVESTDSTLVESRKSKVEGRDATLVESKDTT